jgi:hypothetical protein
MTIHVRFTGLTGTDKLRHPRYLVCGHIQAVSVLQ